MDILSWPTKTGLTLEVLALEGNCLEKRSERTLGKESDTLMTIQMAEVQVGISTAFRSQDLLPCCIS